MTGLLLDTCAILWIAMDDDLSEEAVEAVDAASDNGWDVCVSPISAWEIGLLASRGRLASPLSPEGLLGRVIGPGFSRYCDLTPETMIAASFLPGELHRDPADRILAATARALDLTLVTRDRALLSYAEAGHLRAIPC